MTLGGERLLDSIRMYSRSLTMRNDIYVQIFVGVKGHEGITAVDFPVGTFIEWH